MLTRSSAITPLAFACVITLAACDRARDPVRPAHVEPTFAISDGAHGGNQRFYFLPPLTSALAYVGIFDPHMTPEVRVCELAGAVCAGPYIATFPFGTGPGTVSVDAVAQSYGVAWKTNDLGLAIGTQLRLHVYLNVVLLGYLDVQVIDKKGDPVPAGFTGIVVGKQVNIKFRIEREPVPGFAFHSNRDLKQEIYWMDQSNPGNPTPAVVRLTNDDTNDQLPVRSPNGTKVVFVRDFATANEELWVVNIDGTGLVNVSNGPTDDQNPSWSPDSKRIAFASDRDGDLEIFVANADGSGTPTKLTDNSASDNFPEWSPDGSRILFTSLRNGNPEIYSMNADGSGQVNLSNHALTDDHAQWSPDGSQIVFESTRDGNSEIYRMNADGTAQTRLTDDAADDRIPSFAPASAIIAFVSNRDGDYDVYRMNLDGSTVVNMSDDVGLNLQYSWSRNGRFVVYASDHNGDFELYRLDWFNNTLVQLTNNLFLDLQPSWSRPP